MRVPRFVAADEGPGGVVKGRVGPGEGGVVAGVEAHELVKRDDLLAVGGQIEALRGERAAEGKGGQDDGNQAECQAGKH